MDALATRVDDWHDALATTVVYVVAFVTLAWMVYDRYGIYGLLTPAYRPRRAGAGRHTGPRRKDVHDRSRNLYGVATVLGNARAHREGPKEPAIGMRDPSVVWSTPPQPIGTSIVKPRDVVDDERPRPLQVLSDLTDTGERLRTWEEYTQDVPRIGTSEIKQREAA
jgi:hypothetical protein